MGSSLSAQWKSLGSILPLRCPKPCILRGSAHHHEQLVLCWYRACGICWWLWDPDLQAFWFLGVSAPLEGQSVWVQRMWPTTLVIVEDF